MSEHYKVHSLNDFFVEMNNRQNKGVYFYRINGYSKDIHNFLIKYYEEARKTGVVIEGKIPNPDENNLSYYNEVMGLDFQLSQDFIFSSLTKWLPRMNNQQRHAVSSAIFSTLNSLKMSGKNDNILKNTYIKFMCWLYYKFEQVINNLGNNNIPKILYEGDISNYELLLISVLSIAGCDVVLLQYHGDENYLKLDADSKISDAYISDKLTEFPAGFSLRKIRDEIQERNNNMRLYGVMPSVINCTNAWIEGKGLDDIRVPFTVRGDKPDFFYNCFCRINGVMDKLTYTSELFQFYQELISSGRNVVVVNDHILKPLPDEVSNIRRGNYANKNQMIADLSSNIKYDSNMELQRIMVKAFVDVILEESGREDSNLNKLTSRAIYLLCWLKRYQGDLFSNWKMPEIGCFIYLGGCKDKVEALFMKFLARLPVDVLILCPNLDYKCCLEDSLLYEINYSESMILQQFPVDNAQVRISTVAYQAERNLDSLIYQDSGIYRNQQYSKANAITLQTMYEEIPILWNQELKYRPNFGVYNDTVNLPVIFAKVSGVKDGNLNGYWTTIKELITDDTLYIDKAPYIKSGEQNPMKAYAVEFFKGQKLQRNKIKEHSMYQYGFLREDVQEYIFDKLQMLIDKKIIKGTFENGTEYTIIATILNLKTDILRLIQKFDFTKKNPKVVYINSTETMISLEDSIIIAFLNLIGFDIVFFVPTGYQNIEKYFNGITIEEHQIGEYMYDVQIPDVRNMNSAKKKTSWVNKLFKRGE